MHINGQLNERSLLVMIRLIEVDFVTEQSGYTALHHWRAGCRYRRVPIPGKLFYIHYQQQYICATRLQ